MKNRLSKLKGEVESFLKSNEKDPNLEWMSEKVNPNICKKMKDHMQKLEDATTDRPAVDMFFVNID